MLRELFAQCLYNFSYFILLCSTCRSRILWRSGTLTAVLAHFLCTRRNGIISTSDLKSVVTVVSATLISYEYRNFGDLTKFRCFFRHTLVRMRRNGNFRVFSCIMTLPFDSVIPTNNKSRKFWRSEHLQPFSPFLFAHAHKRHYLYFRSEFCRHRHSQRHRFHNKGMEIFAIWQRFR